MLQHIGELMKKHGLEPQESELIVTMLENGGKMRQKEIMDKLSLTPVTLSPIIERLIEKGLITYNVIIEEGKAPVNEYKLTVV